FKNIMLDNDLTGYPPCEPSIAINPKNPDNIVGAAILDKVYTTFDGGKSWSLQRLTSTYGVFGDPCVIADKKGKFYYLHLSDPSGSRWGSDALLDRIVCQMSKDGGKTWNNGGFMGNHHPKDQDKEWAVASPFKNRIYATWTQFDEYESKDTADKSNILFSYSKNKGKKWSEAVRINQFSGDCLDDDDTVEGAVPAVGPNGEVYVAWSWNEQLWFDRSTDGGKTWLDEDIKVANQPKGWALDIPGLSRSNGMPVLACDLSKGPNQGNLYINWADQKNGTHDTDIWIARSSDGGNTWSEPIRVNQDKPGRHQFLTWMAIDQTTGYLYIVYYDRRNHRGEATDLYLAWSKDGGKTFQEQKISEKPFTPNPMGFFGDYNNISAHAGRICPIWTRMENGRNSVWTAVISQKELDELESESVN
ncbi:MAG: exo-alpha-sialidase, partial [Bacteroidetes bacterium]|nr:exo-alpha-sialidase [Bacteroidota bacterium]